MSTSASYCDPRLNRCGRLGRKPCDIGWRGVHRLRRDFSDPEFTGFIELGLTPEQVGGTPEQIRAFSPHLYKYISHLQVAVAGLMMALGVVVVAIARHGIRTGQRWALWTALLAPVIAMVVALPPHYAYGLATMEHLGPIYLDVAVLVVGIVLARRVIP